MPQLAVGVVMAGLLETSRMGLWAGCQLHHLLAQSRGQPGPLIYPSAPRVPPGPQESLPCVCRGRRGPRCHHTWVAPVEPRCGPRGRSESESPGSRGSRAVGWGAGHLDPPCSRDEPQVTVPASLLALPFSDFGANLLEQGRVWLPDLALRSTYPAPGTWHR